MRLGWVEYVNPMVWRGGGELIMRALIDDAPASGIDLELFSVWPEPRVGDAGAVDAWILVDVYNMPERQRRLDQRVERFLPWTAAGRFERVLRRAIDGRYIHVDNAYVDACSQPYLPCNGVGTVRDCALERRRHFAMESNRLYQRALANFCLSPLHGEILRVLHPAMSQVRLIPPVLSPAPFLAARRTERDIEWLYAGVLTEAKGTDRLDDVSPLVMVTSSKTGPRPAHARVVTSVPYEDMPDWFGRAKRFVYRPRWPEPFGRVVAEAALAGCELEIEGRVGACSIAADLSNPATYEGSPQKFWADVRAVLDGR